MLVGIPVAVVGIIGYLLLGVLRFRDQRTPLALLYLQLMLEEMTRNV
jgi:hypothetical protein